MKYIIFIFKILLGTAMLFPFGGGLAAQSLALTVPVLLTPTSEDSTVTAYPVFTWTPSGSSATLSYGFRLTELFPFQSPAVALQSNPVLYETQGLRTPMLVYPITAPALQAGKSYAWQVTVSDEKDGNLTLAVSEGSQFSRPAESLPPLRKPKKKRKKEGEETFIQPPPLTVSYYLLHRSLFTNVCEVSTDKIGFYLNETASEDTTQLLPLKVYEQTPSESVPLTPEPANVRNGTTAYHLNITGLSIDKVYIVQVTDGRGRQYYLKFKRKGGVSY